MRIPQQTIDSIASKIDILDFISQDIHLERKGDRFWGCCPFHHEKTPSFSVVPEKGFFYCFGCHVGGNIYKYIMESSHVDFLEAVKIAAEKTGTVLEQNQEYDPQEKLHKEALYELYQRVTGSFHWILMNSDDAAKARAYLENRGILKESWDFFQLGYAPGDSSWLYNFLKKKNYSTEFLDGSGLFSKNRKGYPLFRNRLVFPIFDNSGRSVAFSGRLLAGEGPKYINSPESLIYHKGRLLFGLGKTLKSIKEKKSFVLCEGNLDLVSLHQSGFTNVAAPLGTAFTADQLKLLKRYANRGSIVFDNDNAGKKAALKAVKLCREHELPVDVIQLPQGKDPADVLNQSGKESLKKIMSNPVNAFDFLLSCAVESFDVTTSEGKALVVEELSSYLRTVNSEIERVSFLEKTADRLMLDKNVVIREFQGKKGIPNSRGIRKVQKDPEIVMNDEVFLVLLLLFNSRLYPMINEVDFLFLHDDFAKSLLMKLKKTGPLDKVSDWLDLSDQPGWEKMIEEKSSDPLFRMNPEEQLKDILGTLEYKGLLARREEVSLLMKNENVQKNQRALMELLQEKKRLDDQIEGLRVNK